MPLAAWRFEVDEAGGLDVGVLGLRLDAPEPARGGHLAVFAEWR